MDHNQKNAINLFREAYNCKHCLYFEKPRLCLAMNSCPLDEKRIPGAVRVKNFQMCPKDEVGNCPYGNDAGTCFGFCWKEILKDFYKKGESKEE